MDGSRFAFLARARLLGLCALVLALLALGGGWLRASGTTGAQETADGAALTGSWRVVLSFADGRTIVSFATYGADGTALGSGLTAQAAPPGAPPGVQFVSVGHGAWEATGADTANITIVHLIANEEGLPAGTRTSRFAVTVAADGESYSGELATILADPAGAEIATFSATVEATRMHAEGPETPANATPTS